MTLVLPYRRRLLLLAIACASIVVEVRGQAPQHPDLPIATENLVTAPAGTFVIAMDRTNQATSPASGTTFFNLKAYGFAIFLLDLDVKLRWVIKTNKAKDDIDFSAIVQQQQSNDPPQLRNFRAGPLLIFPSDVSVEWMWNYLAWFNVWQPDSSKVKVYRLVYDTQVDVRYTLAQRPRAALLHDSCDIHRNFMEMASVPEINYDCLPDASTLRYGCYTIATEPHIEDSSSVNGVTAADADSIYNFVMAGGNFLAECEGVKTFENWKKYQSVTGDITKGAGGSYNNNVFYDNADMAYCQFDGVFRPHLRGVLKIWNYNSSNQNNWYPVVRCTSGNSTMYGAAVSKMNPADTGSVVFYLGNHEYVTHDCHEPSCVSNQFTEYDINGIRLFLNAVLIPSKVQPCIFNTPLAVQLNEFNAYKKNNEAVQLEWSSLTEEDKTMYFIEHSTNGKDFSIIGQEEGLGLAGSGYKFLHTKPVTGVNYYRLRIISIASKTNYSEIRQVAFGYKDQNLTIYPNPTTGIAHLLLDVKEGERLQVSLYDGIGRLAKQNLLIVRNQKAELNTAGLSNGIYWVVISDENGKQHKAKLQVIQ